MTLRRLTNLFSPSFKQTGLALGFCFLTLFSISCGSIETNSNIGLATSGGDEDVGLEPDGDLSPGDTSTPVDPGTEPGCTTFDSISVAPASIDFGLKQLEDKECQRITINGCVPFIAEIVYPEGTEDSAKQFAFFDSTGTELTGRQSNLSEGVDLCYKRQEIGSHRGRANIVIDGSGITYATGIPLSGSTEDYVFDLSNPTEGMLVWEQDGVTSFDATSGSFSVPVAGTVNTDLSSIITGNQVTVAGGISPVSLDASSNSFTGTFNIPSTPEEVHPITISIPSSKGPLEMVRNVIRYTRPAANLEIRDVTGNRVNSTPKADASQTDSQKLILGVNVTNLTVSGPTEYKLILTTLKIKKGDTAYMTYNADDEEWTSDLDDSDSFSFYNGYASKEGVLDATSDGENGHCGDKFENPLSSYCVLMPPTAWLERGINTVEATLCNDYTTYEGACVVVNTTILVDNDVPIINISSPIEDRVYAGDTPGQTPDTITATITIDNFVMNDVEVKVDETTQVETRTETCAVKLWLNNSILQAPVNLCDHVKQIVASEDASTTNGNNGNIRRAIFEVTLNDLAGNDTTKLHALTLYTNLLHIESHNASNHFAYKTVSFQRGERKNASPSPAGSGKVNLSVGPMGTTNGSSHMENAPIMMYVAEDTVQEEQIKTVLRKALNDNFSFATLAMNLGFTFDQKEETLKDLGIFGLLKPKASDKQAMLEMLHKSAPEQVMAILNLKQAYGDNNKYFTPTEAEDACGFPITTAIITPDMMENIYARWNVAPDFITERSEWPSKICGNDLDCKKGQPEQGIWDIDVDLKDDGYVDVSLILKGKQDDDGVMQPAFAGHFLAYNLIANGTTGEYTLKFVEESGKSTTDLRLGLSDPTIPLYFNVGKLTLSLKDVLRIYKAQKNQDGSVAMCDTGRSYNIDGGMLSEKIEIMEPCECTNNNCTNVVFAAPDKILNSKADYMKVELEPYDDCADYFHNRWPDANLPLGCREKKGKSTAVALDTNSILGLMYYSPTGEGNYDSLIEQILSVLDHTFRNTVGCMPTAMANPMIDPEAFDYPYWVPEKDRNQAEFAVGTDKDGEMAFGFKQALIDDGTDIAFSVKPDLRNADLIIKDGGALVKAGAEIGADNVDSNFFYSGDTKSRSRGYMYRQPEDLNSKNYPLGQTTEENGTEKPYVSLSLNLEELGNGALYTLIEKGLWDTLKLVGFDDELTGPSGYTFDNWTIGVDKVILGRFGICGKLTPEASADLAPSVLFAAISGQFQNEFGEFNNLMHLDVTLKHAPTLALLPVELPENFELPEGEQPPTILQVGIPNVEISTSPLLPIEDGDEVTYKIGKPVVKVRGDILLKVIVQYKTLANGKKAIDIYLLPREQQAIYFSVLDRGINYDDSLITGGLNNTVLPLTLDPISGIFDPTNPEIKPGFQLIMPHSITDEIELIKNVTPPSPEECTDEEGDDEPQYYVESNTINLTGKWADLFINFWKAFANALKEGSENQEQEESAQQDNTNSMSMQLNTHVDFNQNSMFSTSVGSESKNTDDESNSDDPCAFLEDEVEDPDNKTLSEQLKESLCDFGIEEAYLEDPELKFDFKNGYLHVGTGLGLKVYDWVIDEVSPYEGRDTVYTPQEDDMDLQEYQASPSFINNTLIMRDYEHH